MGLSSNSTRKLLHIQIISN